MILSDDEINAAYIEAANQTLRLQDERIALGFARAIIAATVAKLAAGVEPVAWRITTGENTPLMFDYREDEPDDASKGWVARWGRKHEPLYTATAVAAARVQANERLACEFDKLYTYGGDEIGPAIRALIGETK